MNITQKTAFLLTSSFLGLALPVSAHAPSVVIETIDGHPGIPGETIPIIVPDLPWTVYIEGYVEHSGNWDQVDIRATDNDVVMHGPEALTENFGFTQDGTYIIPWYIESPGVHVIKVVAAHGKHESSTTLGSASPNTKKGCPAAPSIANKYLKANGYSNKNIIPEIAHAVGKKGTLWAKESCNPDYEERTITIVIDLVE